jgi:hypothetical protein
MVGLRKTTENFDDFLAENRIFDFPNTKRLTVMPVSLHKMFQDNWHFIKVGRNLNDHSVWVKRKEKR